MSSVRRAPSRNKKPYQLRSLTFGTSKDWLPFLWRQGHSGHPSSDRVYAVIPTSEFCTPHVNRCRDISEHLHRFWLKNWLDVSPLMLCATVGPRDPSLWERAYWTHKVSIISRSTSTSGWQMHVIHLFDPLLRWIYWGKLVGDQKAGKGVSIERG